MLTVLCQMKSFQQLVYYKRLQNVLALAQDAADKISVRGIPMSKPLDVLADRVV